MLTCNEQKSGYVANANKVIECKVEVTQGDTHALENKVTLPTCELDFFYFFETKVVATLNQGLDDVTKMTTHND